MNGKQKHTLKVRSRGKFSPKNKSRLIYEHEHEQFMYENLYWGQDAWTMNHNDVLNLFVLCTTKLLLIGHEYTRSSATLVDQNRNQTKLSQNHKNKFDWTDVNGNGKQMLDVMLQWRWRPSKKAIEQSYSPFFIHKSKVIPKYIRKHMFVSAELLSLSLSIYI